MGLLSGIAIGAKTVGLKVILFSDVFAVLILIIYVLCLFGPLAIAFYLAERDKEGSK